MLINCDPTCSSLLPEDRVCRPPSLSDVNGRKLHFEAFALSAGRGGGGRDRDLEQAFK